MLNVLGEADGEEGSAAAKAVLDKAYKTSGECSLVQLYNLRKYLTLLFSLRGGE